MPLPNMPNSAILIAYYRGIMRAAIALLFQWAPILCLLLSLQVGATQYVYLTAEIETVSLDPTGGSRRHAWEVRCVVGTNTWQMEGEFVQDTTTTWWNTGTNLIEQTVLDATGYTFKSVGAQGQPVDSVEIIHYTPVKEGTGERRYRLAVTPGTTRHELAGTTLRARTGALPLTG